MDPIFVLLLLAFVGVAVAGLVSSRRSTRRRQQQEAEALAQVQRAAEEDVIRLGEDVTALDLDLTGRPLDEAARQDYRHALDAYDAAKAALESMRVPDDVRAVTQAIEDGRYAMACVRARIDGKPLPVRRPPCFFNPQHGPSVTDVQWAPPGGAPRNVPACAADAERVRVGAEPHARQVLVDGRRRPYWEAGPAYGPWAQGYFAPYAMSGLLPGILMGAVLGGAMSGGMGAFGGGWDDYGDAGAVAGADGGMDPGMDGGVDPGVGGFQDPGMESGFGDYGGGDYGGGDFGGFGGGE